MSPSTRENPQVDHAILGQCKFVHFAVEQACLPRYDPPPALKDLPGRCLEADPESDALSFRALMPMDSLIIDWRTNPRFCRGLAFLRAHAVMLRARQRWPFGR